MLSAQIQLCVMWPVTWVRTFLLTSCDRSTYSNRYACAGSHNRSEKVELTRRLWGQTLLKISGHSDCFWICSTLSPWHSLWLKKVKNEMEWRVRTAMCLLLWSFSDCTRLTAIFTHTHTLTHSLSLHGSAKMFFTVLSVFHYVASHHLLPPTSPSRSTSCANCGSVGV